MDKYPSDSQLRSYEDDEDYRLTSITYKVQESSNESGKYRDGIAAIKLGFADGSESPLFEADKTSSSSEEITIDIDDTRTIAKVGMKFTKVGAPRITGIYLVDE